MRYLMISLFLSSAAMAQWPVVLLKVTKESYKFFERDSYILAPVINGNRIVIPASEIKGSKEIKLETSNKQVKYTTSVGLSVKSSNDNFVVIEVSEDISKNFNITGGQIAADVRPGMRVLAVIQKNGVILVRGGVISAVTEQSVLTDAVPQGIPGVLVTPQDGQLIGVLTDVPSDYDYGLAYAVRINNESLKVAKK